jgi:N-acetylmuramoyl-L-alanine amidase
VDYPVKWVGSPNHYTNDLEDVVAFVVHTMGGSLAGTDSWFNDPASQVSSHYGTGLRGALHQYVNLDDGAWTNGRLEPGNKWQARYGTGNPNHRVISCETEDLGNASQVVTDEEYAATLAAGRRAVDAWPSIEVVTSHHVISPQTRPNCCGARWIQSGRLAELAADLGREMFI